MNGWIWGIFLSFWLRISFSLSVDEKCQRDNQTFSIYFWDKQPYIYKSTRLDNEPEGFFVILIKEALKQCCLATTNIRFVKENSGPAGLRGVLDEGVFDVIAPVHGFPDSFKVHGLPFVSVAESTGTAVLMLSNASGAKLILSVLQAWPILVFIIVSALLAGVLMWFLERKGKLNQFSESFSLGIFEGFWWAFCTMTTVGYGDRAPKTIPGKILGSIWMLIGVIIVTMFISIITTSLTSASFGQYTYIRGMKVSVENQSTEHILAIRSNTDKVYASPNQEDAFDKMINRDHGVEASLLDTHALKYHMPRLAVRQHVVVATVVGNHISYGLLLPRNGSSKLVNCLRKFMEKNEMWRFELLRKGVGGKKVQINPAEDYFGSGGIFSISVYSGLALFVVLIIIGLIWEYQKPKRQLKKSYHISHKLTSQQSKTTTRQNGPGHSTPNRVMPPFIPASGASIIEQAMRSHPHKQEIITPPTPPQSSTGDTPWEKLIARQKMEVLNLENDFCRFEKDWEKRYQDMQMKQTTTISNYNHSNHH